MVHTFKRQGLCLALDTASGAVHLLDAPAFCLLQNLSEAQIRGQYPLPNFSTEPYNSHKPEALNASLKELRQLSEEELLFTQDNYEGFLPALGLAPIKAMCLHIAHDCNLRCRYCFASTGGFGQARQLMDLNTACRAIDFVVEASGERKNLEIDFFGGEPLMNFDVVKETVKYARAIEHKACKVFRFTLTTNGVLLDDDAIDFINREMKNVVLSIDGRKEIHDRMRPKPGGAGSYDDIVLKFQELVRRRQDGEYYVRGTYTRNNLDFDKDVLHLAELGFDQISVEPVVGKESDSYAIREADLPAIEKSYVRLLKDMVKKDGKERKKYNFFHFMLDLDNGPCAIKRLKGCGSGNEYVAITPAGELYPCHQFVGDQRFCMGTLQTGITNHKMRQAFADAHVLNKAECQKCWAKYFCSGGCNANNHAFAGSITQPHKLSCALEKIRLECAIALQAMRLSGHGAEM